MSLATRCTNCGTIFRVVQDQLRVSEGWVRCGRCSEVFNALQALFDLEREAPPPFAGAPSRDAGAAPGPSAAAAPMATPIAAMAAATVAAPADSPSSNAAAYARGNPRSDGPMAPGLAASAAGGLPPSPTSLAAADAPEALLNPPAAAFEDAMPGPALLTPAAPQPGESMLDTRAEPGFDPTRQEDGHTRVDDPIDADRLGRDAPDVLPAFLRDDEPARARSSPLARALVGFGVVAMSALLVAQVAVHHRDRVAQAWPWSRPLLAQWCTLSGCELLDAPRRIEAFTVESSSLTRAAASSEAYRLSVTLRNRSAAPAWMPSIDIALNDGSGKLLARRALNPSDFRVGRPVVAGNAETTLQLVMTAAQGRVNGYTIEIFYP